MQNKKEKMNKCPKYQNNGYFDVRLKERNKKKRYLRGLTALPRTPSQQGSTQGHPSG
jgi:hypothetical protein